MTSINKDLLEHLAKLSRIDLTEEETTTLQNDLQNIVAYFETLQTVNTKNIEPMTGGTSLVNALRDDTARDEYTFEFSDPKTEFPDRKDDHLKIPPVFDEN